MQLPTLDEAADRLKTVSGLADLDPDAPLGTCGVDSLHLMEWVYAMQESHPDLGIDESLFGDFDETTTFRAVHDRVVRDSGAAAP